MKLDIEIRIEVVHFQHLESHKTRSRIPYEKVNILFQPWLAEWLEGNGFCNSTILEREILLLLGTTLKLLEIKVQSNAEDVLKSVNLYDKGGFWVFKEMLHILKTNIRNVILLIWVNSLLLYQFYRHRILVRIIRKNFNFYSFQNTVCQLFKMNLKVLLGFLNYIVSTQSLHFEEILVIVREEFEIFLLLIPKDVYQCT